MRLPILAAVALALPLAAGAQNTGNTWSWSGDVGTDKWVRIASINGPIAVEPSPDGRVHVTAEKRARRGDPSQVRFEVVERDGNVTICALWNENARCTESGMSSSRTNRSENNDTEVHFRVRLPATANVAPTTVNGAINVASASRQVKATTVNGGIEVATAGGPVNATTVNGSIKASVGTAAVAKMSFTTVNGGIEVSVPRGLGADVKMTTVNGSISTDIPLTMEGRWGPRTASGRIGAGGEELSLTTVNGSLRLRSL
jgi:hypothetical protein